MDCFGKCASRLSMCGMILDGISYPVSGMRLYF